LEARRHPVLHTRASRSSFVEGPPVGLQISVAGGPGSAAVLKAKLALTGQEAIEVNTAY
jgi:hypothetical protein